MIGEQLEVIIKEELKTMLLIKLDMTTHVKQLLRGDKCMGSTQNVRHPTYSNSTRPTIDSGGAVHRAVSNTLDLRSIGTHQARGYRERDKVVEEITPIGGVLRSTGVRDGG